MILTAQQEQVLALISAGATIADAAQSAGIHRNTIHNWLRSAPAFHNALMRARHAKAIYWHEQAEQLAADALATIRALMTDPKTPASTRLKAAQLILNLATNPILGTPEIVPKFAQSLLEPEPLPQLPEVGAGVSECGPEPEKVHNSAQAAAAAQREPQQPYRRATPKIGRNDLCSCGSGKKFKRCCLEKIGFDPSPKPAAA